MCHQGRIIHCASVGAPPPPPAGTSRSASEFLTRCFDVFERLNVQCRLKRNNDDTKNVVNFLGKNCTAREKILATRTRKGSRLTLVWGPRMVNPALYAIPQTKYSSYQSTIGRYCLVRICKLHRMKQSGAFCTPSHQIRILSPLHPNCSLSL